jgi:hypothetical protein
MNFRETPGKIGRVGMSAAETPEAKRQSVLFINFDHLYINVCYCKISIGAFPPNSQHIQGVPKNVPSVVG